MMLPKVIASEAVPPDTLLVVSGARLDPRKVHLAVDEAIAGADATWRVTVRVERGALTILDAAKVVGFKEGEG